MAWILKMLLSIIIDLIDLAVSGVEATGVGTVPAIAWSFIQMMLIMTLWPNGSSLLFSAIDFIPVISGFLPAATIAGIMSGMSGADRPVSSYQY
jgi:hypothetical protein